MSDDRGLAALADALNARDPSDDGNRDWTDPEYWPRKAAAILGEHGVFLPDGTHKAYTALAEQTATIIDLNDRLALTEDALARLVEAMYDEYGVNVVEETLRRVSALATAVNAALATAQAVLR